MIFTLSPLWSLFTCLILHTCTQNGLVLFLYHSKVWCSRSCDRAKNRRPIYIFRKKQHLKHNLKLSLWLFIVLTFCQFFFIPFYSSTMTMTVKHVKLVVLFFTCSPSWAIILDKSLGTLNQFDEILTLPWLSPPHPQFNVDFHPSYRETIY